MKKNPNIDLGLAVSGALLEPGKTRTQEELAAFAGCTHGYIRQIELKALKKLRHSSRISQLCQK
jgi:DNA-directed RNA polymerase sigma subunit (sigma70/sigma32)